METIIYIGKIYDYLHLKKLTQPKFAKKCGLSLYRLQKILKGDVISIFSNLDKIAYGLDMAPSDLINLGKY